MPKDKDLEISPAEAERRIKAHEAKHGREAKVPPGQEKKNDVPTQAELDTDPAATDNEGDEE